LVVG
jgi:hypothetical protein